VGAPGSLVADRGQGSLKPKGYVFVGLYRRERLVVLAEFIVDQILHSSNINSNRLRDAG